MKRRKGEHSLTLQSFFAKKLANLKNLGPVICANILGAKGYVKSEMTGGIEVFYNTHRMRGLNVLMRSKIEVRL